MLRMMLRRKRKKSRSYPLSAMMKREQYQKKNAKKTLKTKRRARGSLDEERGSASKIKTNVVVHGNAKRIETADGSIKINLAKFILREITVEDLEEKEYKNARDSQGAKLEASVHWECMLHSNVSVGGRKHTRFVRVGSNSVGNLMKHCRSSHQHVLDSAMRIVLELPASEAKTAIVEHIRKQCAPKAGMEKFVTRKAGPDQLSIEALFLIWYLDGQIPFSQLDNEFFREIVVKLNLNMGSSETIVLSLLPVLYRYCVGICEEFLHSCSSYATSYDGWSRFGKKFISQTYHCINPDIRVPYDFDGFDSIRWTAIC